MQLFLFGLLKLLRTENLVSTNLVVGDKAVFSFV